MKLAELIKKIVRNELSRRQIMQRCAAKVTSVNSAQTRAEVVFTDDSKPVSLLNKTGEMLSAGDSVWIQYRTLPSSGYIAMRNGEAVPLGGSGGGDSLRIESAAVLSPSEHNVFATVQETINVDMTAQTVAIYGNSRNSFVRLGTPLIFDTTNNWQSRADLKDLISAKLSVAAVSSYGWDYYERVPRITSISYNSETKLYTISALHFYRKIKAANPSETVPGTWGSDQQPLTVTVAKMPKYFGGITIVRELVPDSNYYYYQPCTTPYGYVRENYAMMFLDDDGNYLAGVVTTFSDASPFASEAECDFALGMTQRKEVVPIDQ